MARIFLTKQGARKSTGGKAPRKALGRGPPGPRRAASAYRRPTSAWHPALIAAVNDGGWERIFGALAAKEEWEGQHVCYKVGRKGQHRHPDSVQGAGQGLVTVPFPLSRLFGLLPYAAYRGHEEVVAAFCAAGFDPEGTAQVLTVRYSVRWAWEGLGLPDSVVGKYHTSTPWEQRDSVRTNALQIACFKRDTVIVRLLCQVSGVPRQHPFLLDLTKPEPGSLMASQGTWSPAFHRFCPPAFKAATAELLRISRKHGGTVGPGGSLRWAFTPATLVQLLLPALADDMSPWLDGMPNEAQWLAGQAGAGEQEEEEEEEDAEEGGIEGQQEGGEVIDLLSSDDE